MQEALTLFDSICNSRWFVKTSIVIFSRLTGLAHRSHHPPSDPVLEQDRPVHGETPPVTAGGLFP
jgi:hypothetical protein